MFDLKITTFGIKPWIVWDEITNIRHQIPVFRSILSNYFLFLCILIIFNFNSIYFKMNKIIIYLFFLGFPVIGMTQKFDLAELQNKYPENEVAFLQQNEHLHVDIVDGQFSIYKDVDEKILYLKNDARYSNESIYYTSFEYIENIKAWTQLPNGKKVKVDNIETEDVMSGGVFYNDTKRKTFVYPAIAEGVVTNLSYREMIKDPHMLGVFFFDSFGPILNGTYQVTFPKEVELAYELQGEDTDKVNFKKTTKKGKTTYTWTVKDNPAYEFETNAPNRAYYTPHLILRIASAEIDGKKVNILSDVDDLYKWYRTLIKDINKTDQNELKNIVSEITKDKPDNKTKAKAIYRWVQENIKYVAFEDGLGGFIPRDAAKVCSKKYGDCKDMANLLVEMLGYADIPAHLTWIGTRDKPYTYEKVPTPMVDNHMITALKLDGKYTFLDATGNLQPFELPTSMIQGKEALIAQDEKNYEIVTVPVIPREENQWKDVTTIEIVDKNLKGKTEIEVTGYRKIDFEYAWKEAEDKEQFSDSYFKKGNNKFKIAQPQVNGLNDPAKAATVNFDFEVPNYVTALNNKIFINMNLKKPYQKEKIDIETRKYDRKIKYKNIHNSTVKLKIPAGYKVDYLPEALSFIDGPLGATIEYLQEGNMVVLKQSIFVNTLMVKKSDFPAWNKAVKQLNKAYKEAVVLVK